MDEAHGRNIKTVVEVNEAFVTNPRRTNSNDLMSSAGNISTRMISTETPLGPRLGKVLSQDFLKNAVS